MTECRCHSNRHDRTIVANCSYSNLASIPDAFPQNTDWLLLIGNRISDLDADNKKLYYLSELDVESNNIANISSQIMDGLVQTNKLEYFDISNNKLTSLPENIKNLTSLKILKISGNIFKCSCEHFWMKEWLLNETQIVDDFKNIKCHMKSAKWIPIVHMDKADIGCVHFPKDMFALWKIIGKPNVPYFIFFKAI